MSTLDLTGWTRTTTGGGCTALMLNVPTGHYLFTRDAMEPSAADMASADDLVVGFWGDLDDYNGPCFTGTASACLAWVAARENANAWQIVSVDLDQTTREIDGATWEGSLTDFLEGNEEDTDTCDVVARLAVGESVEVGGGAFALSRITRLS